MHRASSIRNVIPTVPSYGEDSFRTGIDSALLWHIRDAISKAALEKK